MKTAELLDYEPYSNSDAAFSEALQEELSFHYENNEMYRNFCLRKGFDPREKFDLQDIPPVSVSVFKQLGARLSSVPKDDLTLTIKSSATSGIPSTILVDKSTAKNQAKAMIKVVGDFIGKERKPFLIMDIDPRSENKKFLGARFAAVTGYLKFANKAEYFLNADSDGVFSFDVKKMSSFVAGLDKNLPVVVFGFTYILFKNVLSEIEKSGVKISLPKGSKIIHIGGWKKLESEKISKELFNRRVAECFSVSESDVIDIYGFTEQMGLNYPDCKCGFKHTPAYSRVLVRDVSSHEVLKGNQEGLLEFLTPIQHSYPGNAVLTDDLGFINPEPCPFGRGGVRFKITGRMKKAEIRGCGDILSQKLTFLKTAKSDAETHKFEVRFFEGELKETEAEKQLEEIISALKDSQQILKNQSVEMIIGLISKVAKKWKNEFFLSSWCSYEHLHSIAAQGLRGDINHIEKFLPFAESHKRFMKAGARGLVCHWLSGNVQILGMFALVQSIICKNVNLLKVSSRDGGVFENLLQAFRNEEFTKEGITIKGNDVLKTVALVYYDHNSDRLGKKMSACADVRIAWGGHEAVEAVMNYPAKYNCETVIYGPKLSFSVVDKEDLSYAQEAKKLARRISVDVSVFDQTGCASPHNLFVEKGGAVSPEEFCKILSEAMQKTEFQIPKPVISAEQVAQIHSVRGLYDFKGKVFGSDSLSYTVLYDDDKELSPPVYSRCLFVHAVDSIDESLGFVTTDIQTIGIPSVEQKYLDFAEKAASHGAARFPLIGRMLNFETPWDGIFLIDRLVKWQSAGSEWLV